MKKILMVLITLISFNSFAEELIKDEDVVKEETSIQVVEDETTENVINLDEIKEQSGKFVRLKVVGGIEGKVRTKLVGNDSKTTVWDRDNDFELILEGVYRAGKTYEVAIGTGIQQFGKIENSGDEFYSTPLYLSVKRNFFKGPIYIKGLGGIVYNHNSNGIKEFFLAHTLLTGITETEINNGYYYGGGIGLDLGNLELEALYCVNELEAKFVNSTGTYYSKIDNNRISLGISYAFEVGK